MKIKLILLLVFFSRISYGQLDDILKKTVGNPDAWIPGKSITTSINDILPTVNYLGKLSLQEPEEITDLTNIKPGYYKATIESYCLKAGTYGPTKGDGYVNAPLLGKNADIVSSILSKTVNFPNIAQHDVQLLLWSIEAGTKFTDLPGELQLRVKPLLSTSDLVRLNVEVSDAVNLLPGELVELGKYYKDMRDVIKNPKSTFQEIEKLAVRTTGENIDFVREDISKGKWTYIGNGYFMRSFPENYMKTHIELIALPDVKVVQDSKKRITSISGNGYTADIEYDDDAGRNILSTSGNPDLPIWRFKKVTYTTPDEQVSVENSGWMLRDGGKPISGSSGTGVSLPTDAPDNTPSYSEYMERLNSNKIEIEGLKKSNSALKRNKAEGEKGEFLDFDPDNDIKKGMDAVKDPGNMKDKAKWFNNNLSNTMGAWWCAISSLGGGSCGPTPPKPPMPKFPNIPANTGAQRLGNSLRNYPG